MGSNVKIIYTWLMKYNHSPMETFGSWNKMRGAANNCDKPMGAVYPEYVRMLMRYRVINGS